MKALCGRVSSAVPDKYSDGDTDLLNKNPETLKPLIEQALDKALAEIKNADRLLDHVCDIKLAAQPRFVAADYFKVDTSKGAKVKFSYLSDRFTSEFVDDAVEEPVPAAKLSVDKLLKAAHDTPLEEGEQAIIPELGSDYELSRSQMYAFLAQHGDGESGDWFIFYMKGKNGLRAVYASWSDGGWNVYANSVESPLRWDAGYQVVSRKPSAS